MENLAVARKSFIDEEESIKDLVLYKGTIQGCILFILSDILSKEEELNWKTFESYIDDYEIYAGLSPSPRYNDVNFIKTYISDNGLITK